MSILKDLPELVELGIISPDSADRIRTYYQNKAPDSTNRILVVFGILGALLVGLGLFLIIAHNWDELSNGTKTFFAFLPMVVGLGFGGYSLAKRTDSVAWREGSAAFLFLALGACLALIAQIYNLPEDLGQFLFKWMLLSLPIVYVMRSSMASMMYFIGIAYFALNRAGGWRRDMDESYWYWLMLLAGLPYYIRLAIKTPMSNFVSFHHWVVPISIALSISTIAREQEDLMFLVYFVLFGLFYLVGLTKVFKDRTLMGNGYAVIGLLGMFVLLIVFSFDGFWKDVIRDSHTWVVLADSPEFYGAMILSFASTILLALHIRSAKLDTFKPMSAAFLFVVALYFLGLPSFVSATIMNVIMLVMGVWTIVQGAKQENLGTLNLGMLMITALIVSRFFDTDLSFILRGILFVALGAGFFVANYWMISKRKSHGQ